ncbi:MAG: ABC transporter permease, partial [Shimia sp.]
MIDYLLRRLLSLGVSLIVASMVVFAVVEVIPGDPAAFMLGVNAQPDTIAALRAEMGLDDPLPQRYAAWVGGMLTGDFGTSWTYKTPVAELVADRVWVSLPLALYALILSTALAVPAGLYAAARRDRAGDAAVMGATQLGVAIPNFWFAMILVLIFAIHLRWVSAGGFPGWSDPIAALAALTLPAIALALPQAAILARVLRSALLDTLSEDYIRTARA